MAPSLSKKRKHPAHVTDTSVPAKKAKKVAAELKCDKGKAPDREFHVVQTSMVVSVPPLFTNNPRSGVEELLDSMVMRYIPALRGVVLSHSNLWFIGQTANIQADCPFLVCKIVFDATIWSPHVGMKLVGKINLCSPDHISLLVHRTFNISIPRHHIPEDDWEFEYGPAENDPEFGATTEDTKAEDTHGGRWVHKLTGEKLGDPDGYLEFTVIGLKVANEMLSLLGSIQPDPFSPEHVVHVRPPQVPSEGESEMENVQTTLEDVESDEQ